MKNNVKDFVDIKNISKDFGVYLWKDENNKVLYVGKSKNLQNRINQYLNGSLNSYKTAFMLQKAKKLECIVCSNEKESLLLEQELIKKYRPYYNILLLDDKKYPYIVLELKKNNLEIKTKYFYQEKNNTYYYGPLPTGSGYKILKNFLIRECLFENGLPIKSNDYEFWKSKFNYGKKILSSSNQSIINNIKEKMNNASINQQYELAAELRDVILYLSNKKDQNQSITDFNNIANFDVVVFLVQDNLLLVLIHHFVNGAFFVQEEFVVEIKTNLDDSITQFINQFYLIRNKPQMIITNINIKVENLYFDLEVKIPKKGKYFNALENAIKNLNLNKEQKILAHNQKSITALKAKKMLEDITNSDINEFLIIDNSNFSNQDVVSVIAYYKDYLPLYSNYRKYNIDLDIQRKSDVEYIFKGLDKYFSNLDNSIPDLIIVDGGKQQIKEAQKIIKKFDLKIPVIGLVKDEKHNTKSIISESGQEHNFFDRDIYNYFAHIQTEVDEYAKRFHAKKAIQNSLHGSLTKIKGIGPKMEQKLISHFKTYSNIYNATYQELIKVVPENIAKKILGKN